MKIAITAPTGNIGRKLVAALQEQGEHKLVLLARDESKLTEEKSKGAEIKTGDLTNADYVKEATKGVDSLFCLIPPNFASEDMVGLYKTISQNFADAIQANGIRRAVLLSSVGAHLGRGVGPVNGAFHAEQIMRKATPNLVIMRPGYFMENFLHSMETIKSANSVFLPMSPEASVPMIATQDIAAKAAELLSSPFHGTQLVPLHGPKDYTLKEATEAISEALGMKLEYVQVAPEQVKEALTGIGATENAADLMLELYDSIDSGRMHSEQPRTKDTTTGTTMQDFAEAVLAPNLKS